MTVVNKVIVTSRLSNGDDVNVSVKANDRPFSLEDRKYLENRINQSILPTLDDSILLKVRLQTGKKHENWNKLKGIAELNSVLDIVFEGAK